METKDKILLGVIIAAIFVTGAAVGGLSARISNGGGVVGTDIGVIRYKQASSTSRLITTSSTLAIATTSERNGVTIRNNSGAELYCTADRGRAAVLFEGFVLATTTPEVTFSADNGNLYIGSIFCISRTNSASTTIHQW